MNAQLKEIELGVDIDFGSPARLTFSDMKLTLYLEKDEPIGIENNASLPDEVLISFIGCVYHRLGPPESKDLIRSKHYSIGVIPYRMYSIANSEFIKQVLGHEFYNNLIHNNMIYYIITLGDNTLEVISIDFKVSINSMK